MSRSPVLRSQPAVLFGAALVVGVLLGGCGRMTAPETWPTTTPPSAADASAPGADVNEGAGASLPVPAFSVPGSSGDDPGTADGATGSETTARSDAILAGHVLDIEGTAIPGVTVRVLSVGEAADAEDATLDQVWKGVTDNVGGFRAVITQPGRYVVQAGGGEWTQVFFHKAASLTDATIFEVDPGDIIAVGTFSLVPAE